MSRRIGLFAVLLGAMTVFALAQNQERGTRRPGRRGAEAGQPAGPGAEQGRRFEPGQMRERMMTQLKEQMGVTDDQWKTLQPKIEKVVDLRRDLMPMMGGMMGGRMRGGDQAESDVTKAQSELRTTLQEKAPAAETLTKQVTALREAREKVHKELRTAQKDLKSSISTPREEAALVLHGLLD